MADPPNNWSTPWSRVAPSLPPEVAEAAGAIGEGLAAAREAVRVARGVVSAQLAIASTNVAGGIDLGTAALEGAVAAARASLDALLDDVGAYVLIVPLPKKGLAAWLPRVLTGTPGAPRASDDPARASVDASARAADTNAPHGALAAALGRRVADLPVWQRAFAPEALFTGGNAHFLKTVAEALYDEGDGERPTFGRDSYWGYLAVVGGATDVAAAAALAPYAVHLFGASRRSGDVSATRGDPDLVAQDVAVRPYPRGGAVALTWAPVEDHPFEEGCVAAPYEYAVIRSERPEAMTALRVLALFASNDLRVGMEGRHGARVVQRQRYNPVVQRYVDEGPFVPGQVYYYHVAVRTRLEASDGQTKLMPFDALSTAARYRHGAGAAPPARRGAPPDWYRTPSVLRIVPALGQLLDVVNAAIDSATSATTRVTSLTQAALRALDQLVAKLDRIVSEIDTLVGQIGAAYTTPDANIHTTLRAGKGNAATMLGDLASALGDTRDPNRPAFDTGDEYVFGAMVVVTAPSEDAFLRAWGLLELLFGPADAEDPVVAGVRSVADEIARLELAPVATPEPSLTFDEDLSPRPPGRGDASCE